MAMKMGFGDVGHTIPDWFQKIQPPKPTGAYNKGAFQEVDVVKPSGKYKVTGAFENREVAKPSGEYNKAAFENKDVTDFDPYGNYYFSLEIKPADGEATEVAHFMECSGLKTSSTPFEIEEGGMNARTHKRPGFSKWENIQLKYATSASTFLLGWRDKWLTDTDNWKERVSWSGAITLRNNQGEVIKRYEFKNAWPVSWEGPAFSGGGSELAVETLEIAHDGLTVKNE